MMPFNTQAAGFGPWTITNSVAQGASTILTGSKEVILNGAKKIATGTAKITPTAAQVSKVLARSLPHRQLRSCNNFKGEALISFTAA